MRTSSGSLGAALAQALRLYLASGVEAPANFSAQVSTTGRPVATLYRGHQAVIRTGDMHRFSASLLMHLSPVGRLPGQIAVRMGAVIHNGEAVLTSHRISILPLLLSSTLVDQGYQIVDSPVVNLDPLSMTLTVSPPDLEFEMAPLQAWLGAPISFGTVGTYPIKGVVLESGSEAPSLLEVISYLLARAAHIEADDIDSKVEGLIAGIGRVSLHGVGDQRELVAAVQSVLQ